MQLSDFACESLNFSGLGVTAATPEAAGSALAQALSEWVAANPGQRVLQLTPVPATAGGSIGIAALIVHTAGPDLGGELAEQVAAAVEDALEAAPTEEVNGSLRRR
jgi:O-acetyl-ADP-ribose deacetylase (regulator of RNase III)